MAPAMTIRRSLRRLSYGLPFLGGKIHPAQKREIASKSQTLAAILFVACSTAWGQSCKVLDPELQSSYSGPCLNGLAQGEGRASGIAEYDNRAGTLPTTSWMSASTRWREQVCRSARWHTSASFL